MIVKDLIKHLEELPQDLPVYVRYQDPLGESDYWELTSPDICKGEVADHETEKEYPAVLVGDDRV